MSADRRTQVAARYENIVLEEDFDPIEEVVDDYQVKKFAFMLDDYHPWYFGGSPLGKRIGHAAILANDLLQLFTQVYDPNTVVGLHTQEELWFVNPVFVGERVRLYGKYVEKYERRGKGYVVMEMETIYLTQLLTSFFGPSWFTTGWEKMKFIAPLLSGETVTARGVVTGGRREAEGTRLELEIWCENSAGKMTVAGWASARVTSHEPGEESLVFLCPEAAVGTSRLVLA